MKTSTSSETNEPATGAQSTAFAVDEALPSSPEVAVGDRSVTESSPRKVWLVNAPVDLLFCCGGLLWIMVAIHSFLVPVDHRGANFFDPNAPVSEKALGFLMLATSYVFIYPHHAATWQRLYPNKEIIRKYWLCSVVAPIVVCLSVCLVIMDPTWLSWAVRLNGIVTMQHWVAQCYGIGMIYFSRAGFPIGKADRNIIWTLCQLLIGLVTVRFLSSPLAQLNFSMGVSIEPVHFISTELASGLDAFIYASSAVLMSVLAIRWFKARLMPPLAVIALFVTIYRIGLNSADSCVNLFYYGLPFFHSLQYLLVASHFHARENQILGKHEAFGWNTMFGTKKMQKYFFLLALIGGAVYVSAPYVLQHLGIPYGTALVLSFIAFNMHHVFSDAFIWRLREPSVRENVV